VTGSHFPSGSEAGSAVALDVLLEAKNELPHDVAAELHAHLSGAVAELGLTGPARVRTSIDGVPEGAIRVTVNDAKFLLGGLGSPEKGEDTARLISSGLHTDRSAWVSKATAEDLRTKLPPSAGILADRVFYEAMRELARRGVSADHLASVLTRLPSGVSLDDPTVIAEEAMAETAVRLATCLAPTDLAAVQVGREVLNELPEELWARLGLIVPPVDLRANANLSPGHVQILVNDASLPVARLRHYQYPSLSEIAELVREAATDHAGSLITQKVVQFLVSQLATAFPQLAASARERWNYQYLTSALRSLLDDGVPVDNLRALLEAFLESTYNAPHASAGDASQLVAAARYRIGLTTVRRHVNAGVLRVHHVTDRRNPPEPSLREATTARLHEDIAALDASSGIVLLAPAYVAAHLRCALRPRFHDVRVITDGECPSTVTLEPEEPVFLR
jgi:hypothetical protein